VTYLECSDIDIDDVFCMLAKPQQLRLYGSFSARASFFAAAGRAVKDR
jgi:hypothetical protein